MSFFDLNAAEVNTGGQTAALIPDNTVARAILTIRPGGAGEGGWFKQGPAGLMLDTEWTVVDGPYAKRKVWKYMSMSEKAAPITLRQLRAAIEGHHNIRPEDMSEAAMAKRKVTIDQLSGLSACILIGVEAGTNGYADKNTLKNVIAPGERSYLAAGQAAPAAIGGNVAAFQAPAAQAFAPSPAPAPAASSAPKPAWAS